MTIRNLIRIHWVTIVLVVIGTFLLLSSYVHSEEELYEDWMRDCNPEVTQWICDMRRANLPRDPYIPVKGNEKKIEEWKILAKKHQAQAMENWAIAKDRAWYLPDQHEREIAIKCFRAAAASVASAGPCAKLATAVLVLFVEYGVDCIHEYYFIKEHLEQAEYHFYMAEYYHKLSKGI